MEGYEKIDINHDETVDKTHTFSYRHLFNHRIPIILFLLVLLNMLIIDIWIVQNKPVIVQSTTRQIPQSKVSLDESCSNACINQIKQSTAALQLAIPTSKPVQVTQIQTTGTKELYVPFGSGVNKSADWEDVVGLQTYVDSTKYPDIKKVTFEASVHIPTGNQIAYVRLYNATDQHPVWYSEVSLEGGAPKFLVSSPITLDVGNKLYKVQMKTSLQYQAVLDSSRVHILLQ